mmetsp:Transcript_102270/g.125088  ORF Transcript_102270/g.125088 Transcript_102270/m.125088 type:complete len:586 (+) Transcript_102270:9-1766(+)
MSEGEGMVARTIPDYARNTPKPNFSGDTKMDDSCKTDALYARFSVNVVTFKSGNKNDESIMFVLNLDDKINHKKKYSQKFSRNDIQVMIQRTGLGAFKAENFVKLLLFCLSKKNDKFDVEYKVIQNNDEHYLNINIAYEMHFMNVDIEVRVDAMEEPMAVPKKLLNDIESIKKRLNVHENKLKSLKNGNNGSVNELIQNKLNKTENEIKGIKSDIKAINGIKNEVNAVVNEINKLKQNAGLSKDIKGLKIKLNDAEYALDQLKHENEGLKAFVSILTCQPKLRINKIHAKTVSVDIKYNNNQIKNTTNKLHIYYAKLDDSKNNNNIDLEFDLDDAKLAWNTATYTVNTTNKSIVSCKIKSVDTRFKYVIKCCLSNKYGTSNFSDIIITKTSNNAVPEAKISNAETFAWSNDIVQNYDISNLNGWIPGYGKLYSARETKNPLQSICGNSEDIVIFVGAVHKDNSNKVVLGAFGPSSVLSNTSQNGIYIPENWKISKYNVHWYNSTYYGIFGFSKEATFEPKTIRNSYDLYADTADCEFRLCWLLDSANGGYRVGNIIDLDSSDDYYKIIYYKKINVQTLNHKLCSM